MRDDVRNPQHYTEGREYEPIDVIRDWGLNFNLGAVVKYVSRAGRKDDAVEDLQKAVVFLEHEIANLEFEENPHGPFPDGWESMGYVDLAQPLLAHNPPLYYDGDWEPWLTDVKGASVSVEFQDPMPTPEILDAIYGKRVSRHPDWTARRWALGLPRWEPEIGEIITVLDEDDDEFLVSEGADEDEYTQPPGWRYLPDGSAIHAYEYVGHTVWAPKPGEVVWVEANWNQFEDSEGLSRDAVGWRDWEIINVDEVGDDYPGILYRRRGV